MISYLPISYARIHSAAPRQHSIGVEILPDVNVALHDGVVGGLVEADGLPAQETWLEQRLGTSEPLVANSDHLHGIIYHCIFYLFTRYTCTNMLGYCEILLHILWEIS